MDDKVEIETRYFITGLPNNAQAILETKHSRWRIDYCLHWVLDIAF